LLEKAVEIVDMAIKSGADEAETYISSSQQTTIKVHRSEVEVFTTAITKGLGIRVFLGKKLGYAFTSDLTESMLRETVQEAIENASFSAEDRFYGLASEFATSAERVEELGIYCPEFLATPTEHKLDFAFSLEESALKFDPRIKSCEEVVYADEDRTTVLANSKGFSGQTRSTCCYGFLIALAREKEETQTGYSFTVGRHLGKLDGKKAAEEAAQRAVSQLGARPISPRETTVILDPLVAAQILASLSMAITADAAQKGRSFLSGRLGHKIASPRVSIIDDGRLKGGLGTSPFDDEGIATQRTSVVDEGTLATFLHNTYTARREGTKSTGNGRRGSFKNSPAPSPSNLFFSPGEILPEDIIGQVSAGFYVTSLQGIHAGVNPATGQFSVGASGLWIEGGKLSFPVREVTVASTWQEILKNLVAVGSDLRFIPAGGSIGAPTIAVERMTVSGR
jgi:PmbA protein